MSTMTAPREPTMTRTSTDTGGRSVARTLLPLLVDVGVPLGAYFIARDAFGLSLVDAYIVSSVVPVVRTITTALRDRTVNRLSALMLAVNIAGIALSLVTGDVRLMFAKDSGISSVIAFGILLSVIRGEPAMSDGLRLWVTRGDAARTAVWNRLRATSAGFTRLERRYTLIWGAFLLADCVARLACAWTAPVADLGWLSTPILVGALLAASIVSGGAAADPMRRLVDAELTLESPAATTGVPSADGRRAHRA